jgi:hypothetical protein
VSAIFTRRSTSGTAYLSSRLRFADNNSNNTDDGTLCIETSLNCTRFIDHPFIMPWQSVSSLLVVGGAFNVAAGLVGAIHYLSTGVSIKLLFVLLLRV